MLVAGLASFAVLGRRRLAPGIIGAALGVGASLALVSLVDRRAGAVLILIGACGLSASLYELTSRMLLQRISGLDVLGHVFSLVEAVQMAMLAVGSASVPVRRPRRSARAGRPPGVGALMVLTVAVLGPALVRVDRRAHIPLTEMAALRATPLLAPLPAPALETLAREARRQEVTAGTVVVGRGEPGSDYYAVVSGRLHVVTRDRTVVAAGAWRRLRRDRAAARDPAHGDRARGRAQHRAGRRPRGVPHGRVGPRRHARAGSGHRRRWRGSPSDQK